MDQYGYSSHYATSPGMDAEFIDHLLVEPHTSWRGQRGVRAMFAGEEEDFGVLGIALTEQARKRKELRKKGRKVRKHVKENLSELSTEALKERLGRLKTGYLHGGREVQVLRKKGKVHTMLRSDARQRIRMIQRELARRGESFGAADDVDLDLDELDDDLDEELYGRLYVSPEYHELEHASTGDLGALIARSGASGLRGGRPSYGADASVSFGPIQYQGSEWGAFFIGAGALIVLSKALSR
jgi:hypothetical protein